MEPSGALAARTVTTTESAGGTVVGVVEAMVLALVVATLTAVVAATVELVAASAGAEISQTDCPDDGPRFGNNV
jgi:hypothetical protein